MSGFLLGHLSLEVGGTIVFYCGAWVGIRIGRLEEEGRMVGRMFGRRKGVDRE